MAVGIPSDRPTHIFKESKKVSGICRLEDVWNKVVNREEKMNIYNIATRQMNIPRAIFSHAFLLNFKFLK